MTEIPEDIPTGKLIKKYSSAIVDGFVKKAEACGALEHELTKGEIRELFVSNVLRGGRVCLDSLKQFLSDKLLCLMPLPASEVN